MIDEVISHVIDLEKTGVVGPVASDIVTKARIAADKMVGERDTSNDLPDSAAHDARRLRLALQRAKKRKRLTGLTTEIHLHPGVRRTRIISQIK